MGRSRQFGYVRRKSALSALLPSIAGAAKVRFEPFLHDAAPRSNGSNLGITGRSVSVRYA